MNGSTYQPEAHTQDANGISNAAGSAILVALALVAAFLVIRYARRAAVKTLSLGIRAGRQASSIVADAQADAKR
jgi:hypothetical protein